MMASISNRYSYMLPNLDIDLVRAFLAVADHNNFTKASKKLHRTQSAVSMQIKKLEELVECQLFFRDGRVTTLTPDGEYFLSYARRLIMINDELMAKFKQPEMNGVVRIGTPDDYATYFLPELLASFSHRYPKVRLEIHTEESSVLLKELDNGKLDIALVTQQPGSTSGKVIRIEPLLWVASEKHFPEESDSVPLALFPQGCICRKIALDALDGLGIKWHLAFASRSIAAIHTMVQSGVSISALEKSMLPTSARILTEKDGFPELPHVPISVHRSTGQLTVPVLQFVEHIEKSLSVGL